MYKYIWPDLNKVGVDSSETRKARKEVLLITGELICALFLNRFQMRESLWRTIQSTASTEWMLKSIHHPCQGAGLMARLAINPGGTSSGFRRHLWPMVSARNIHGFIQNSTDLLLVPARSADWIVEKSRCSTWHFKWVIFFFFKSVVLNLFSYEPRNTTYYS